MRVCVCCLYLRESLCKRDSSSKIDVEAAAIATVAAADNAEEDDVAAMPEARDVEGGVENVAGTCTCMPLTSIGTYCCAPRFPGTIAAVPAAASAGVPPLVMMETAEEEAAEAGLLLESNREKVEVANLTSIPGA